jgi:hypothetical protein
VESVNRIKDVLDALKTPAGEPKWAKPRKAPSEPGTRPEEEAEIDTPFTDDDGRLPGGRCQVCGGTHGHVGVCPAGLAEMVEWLTRPSRVKVVRRYFPSRPRRTTRAARWPPTTGVRRRWRRRSSPWRVPCRCRSRMTGGARAR